MTVSVERLLENFVHVYCLRFGDLPGLEVFLRLRPATQYSRNVSCFTAP